LVWRAHQASLELTFLSLLTKASTMHPPYVCFWFTIFTLCS
jgi:hypothetical protein